MYIELVVTIPVSEDRPGTCVRVVCRIQMCMIIRKRMRHERANSSDIFCMIRMQPQAYRSNVDSQQQNFDKCSANLCIIGCNAKPRTRPAIRPSTVPQGQTKLMYKREAACKDASKIRTTYLGEPFERCRAKNDHTGNANSHRTPTHHAVDN